MESNHTWKCNLDYYYENIRALTFDTEEGINDAIGLLWTKELRECPHDLAGGDTVIVPTEAVHYFREAGLEFVEKDVLTPSDLPEDELNALRRSQGPF